MEKVKIISIDSDSIVFSNGITLYSYHNQDCCKKYRYIRMSNYSILNI